MRWALLSVWDKTGILDLARTLQQYGVQILSSGGTAKTLRQHGIPVLDIAEYTGVSEMMDGRVKTLHPRIHGGLLGRRGIDDSLMQEQGIHPIDLLVVNLYPFEQMLKQGLSLSELIEFIDVGGPAMIRAAAKNYRDVTVVVDPADYNQVTDALQKGGFTPEERLHLARKAFARTAAYDGAISNYLYGRDGKFPETLFLHLQGGRTLRYGENPHQEAAIYGERGIAGAVPFQGRPMSYNNYLDVHAAVGLLREFEPCCSVIVKHNNPCGVALGETLLGSYTTAREVDPLSAYGSIVACNREVDGTTAHEICNTFVEVVVAPSFTDEAKKEMARKENMRVLLLPALSSENEMRSINGGVLVQRTPPFQEEWRVVTRRSPEEREMRALHLAWIVCRHTRSNAIIFADEQKTLGIGAGQMSRVDAAKIAIMKARGSLRGSVVASDAFLPFADTLEAAAEAGATALIQPGGSIRDSEVITAADRLGMTMIFTGVRYFKH